MAEYQDRSGYNPGVVGSAGGSEPPDTIEAQWLRKLERDLNKEFDGVKYTYSITSYDMGLRTNKSSYSYEYNYSDTMAVDSFLYYRQVFADNVIPDAKGFGSLNLRLGMGF